MLRNWCCTLNNPSFAERVFWTNILLHGHERIMWVRLQEEWPTGGQRHFQFYLELKKRMRMSVMKKVFGRRVHFEARRGTQREADEYCCKDGDDGWLVFPGYMGLKGHWGVLKRMGSDRFELAVTHLKSGGSVQKLKEDYSVQFAMHGPKLLDYHMSLKGMRSWPMEIEVLVGKTGTGKSTTAWDENGLEMYDMPWPIQGHWWMPGYFGQECVILDDYDGQIGLMKMMKLFDRHPWNGLEAKGRSFQFLSKKVIITTNVDPRDWFPKMDPASTHMQAMRRRFREFCVIRDFAVGATYPDFDIEVRADMDTFNWSARNNDHGKWSVVAPLRMIPAGNGDLSQGNGFGRFLNFNMGEDAQ